MATIPQGPEQITSEWLSRALGRDVEVASTEQIGIGVGLLGRLFRVTLADGSSLIAKLPTLDEAARMNVIEPMNFYEKEVRFYQQAAEATPVGTPRLYFAAFDTDSRDFVLLIEDLGTRRMCDQTVGCSVEDAFTAVDTMVNLHAHWWESDRFGTMPWLPLIADPPFPQVIEGMYKQAWPVAQEVFGDRLKGRFGEFGERFPELVFWFVDEGSKSPRTYVHGDFRLDNLFFANGHDAPLIVADWQLGFRGRGGYDLGYFVSQSLATDARRASEDDLIARYQEGLASRGIDYPTDDLRADYARTVAFCFCYPVIAAGQIEFTNERHRALVNGMLARAIAAIEDSNAVDLLP